MDGGVYGGGSIPSFADLGLKVWREFPNAYPISKLLDPKMDGWVLIEIHSDDQVTRIKIYLPPANITKY